MTGIRSSLQTQPPQQVFRPLVESSSGNGNGSAKWEFKTSVSEPVAADIWVRRYEGEESDWDEDDDD